MLISLIVLLFIGLIVGYAGRLILPGAQDIGLVKTLIVGVVSALIVGLVLGSINTFLAIIIGALVAAGLLWVSIRQGWLRPSTS